MTINGISNFSPYFNSSQPASSSSSSAQGGDQNDNGFLIDDELTSQDKALVSSAAGSVDLPNGQINMLAMQIALDRYTGHLQGPVTTSYIEGISKAEIRDGTDSIPQSVLNKALGYLAEQADTNTVVFSGENSRTSRTVSD